ncbi:element excision factor XisH family protein [Aphanizomenon sp. CS-733/32]|uniref:element excision factor XisH family protein n=1 Tax=Aphanizomenon sp. CS-733/32 TaxID=3021715 RepID=UPI00232C4A8C|nr:element excision factor XisH family protein [Aphanizomenon sp. CS-733/32]MDB9310469.1 element excision factor XisH family protein [Aphanizomenon sp. CS-733/32]
MLISSLFNYICYCLIIFVIVCDRTPSTPQKRQYILYRNLINLTEPNYTIYLAIKESTYENFFTRDSIKEIVQLNQILIIVVNVEKEEILQWIN